MTSIREQIDARFRKARLDRDDATKTVIGMLKSRVQLELKAGKDVREDDELWLRALDAYVKQLRKALADFEKAGERAAEARAQTMFEIEFCQGFLPEKLDEAGTEELLRALAAEHDMRGANQVGRLMGLAMKDHKDRLDGTLARAVAQRVLAER
jgi:uncharacterized protein YqeY